MKRFRGLIVSVLLLLACAGQAEAGVGTGLKNFFSYAVAPVPCLTNLGAELVAAVAAFGKCFIGNMNRNPLTLSSGLPGLPTTGL